MAAGWSAVQPGLGRIRTRSRWGACATVVELSAIPAIGARRLCGVRDWQLACREGTRPPRHRHRDRGEHTRKSWRSVSSRRCYPQRRAGSSSGMAVASVRARAAGNGGQTEERSDRKCAFSTASETAPRRRGGDMLNGREVSASFADAPDRGRWPPFWPVPPMLSSRRGDRYWACIAPSTNSDCHSAEIAGAGLPLAVEDAGGTAEPSRTSADGRHLGRLPEAPRPAVPASARDRADLCGCDDLRGAAHRRSRIGEKGRSPAGAQAGRRGAEPWGCSLRQSVGRRDGSAVSVAVPRLACFAWRDQSAEERYCENAARRLGQEVLAL